MPPVPDPPRREPATARFPVVGIGASAGGLEALQQFFSHMPADSGMGFVVVTHQHPSHVSLLPSLLSKASPMPVVEARDGLNVEPNRVYVGPPGGVLGIAGGILQRRDVNAGCTPHLPIDYFFRSLAIDQREHAICVVLSGTGTDGTLGMRVCLRPGNRISSWNMSGATTLTATATNARSTWKRVSACSSTC